MWLTQVDAREPDQQEVGLADFVRLALAHGFTVCVTEPELPEKFPDPLYVAVITSAPDGSPEVPKLAAPFTRLKVANVVAPCCNFTVPVGIPENWGATETLNVTSPPTVDGSGLEVIIVVLVALFTT